MVDLKTLSYYFGGIVSVESDIVVPNGDDLKVFKKGSRMQITNSFIYMVASNIIHQDQFSLLLRSIHQVSESEWIELSEIIVPKRVFPRQRNVTTQGIGKNFNVQIHLGSTGSIVVGSDYNITISSVAPSLKQSKKSISVNLPIDNQMSAFRWLIDKHLDVFKLKLSGLCKYLRTWTEDDYDHPSNPRFKTTN